MAGLRAREGGLKRENLKPWDHTEVADVAGFEGIAVMQRRDPDQQIGGSDDESGLPHLGRRSLGPALPFHA